MKKLIIVLGILAFVAPVIAQEENPAPPVEEKKQKPKKEKKKKKQKLNLTNALIIGQLDNAEDRYSLEINLTEMFTSNGVKSIPSLNIMKLGGDAIILASDSVKQLMAAKGIDTYVLVSVRGYDRRFRVSDRRDDLETALSATSLFDLFRADIVSISFEFKFFRDGKYVYGDMIKCGNVSDRETVLKRFRAKAGKRLSKKWVPKG